MIPIRNSKTSYCYVLFTAFLIASFFNFQSIRSQDIHFSQYYTSDLSTNPALTGVFDGDFRLSGVHRTQWRSVSQPFSTFQLAADAKDFRKNEGLGLGIRIMNDRAGDSKFNTFTLSANLSKSSVLNSDGDLYLHSGIQFGFTQKSIDYSSLRFGEQFNGFSYDAFINNGESQNRDNVTHADIHVGLAVRRNLDYGRHWQIGVSAWNLNTPDVSFKDNARVNLQQRLALHGSYCVIIDDEWDIIPSSRIMVQGPYQEILLGSRFRYTWAYSALEKRRAYLGLFSRLEDGAFITAGLENNEWALGLSYDINLSSLEIASRNRGAFEVTAVYIFDVFDEVRVLHKKCIDIL